MEDYFTDDRSQSAIDSGAAAAADGRYGFLGAQYGQLVKSIVPNRLGGEALSLVVSNMAAQVMKAGAIAGAARAANFGALAGIAYLGGYVGAFAVSFNECMVKRK